MDLREALGPPLDVVGLLAAFSELSLTRGVEQSPYHHLDSFEHTREVVRGVQRELGENLLGSRVCRDRVERLRLAAALHHVAKPVTRGEVEGRMLFVSRDSLGARLVRGCAAGSGSPPLTDLAATLTALHLKIGFVRSDRTDYPREARPGRRSLRGGLTVLSWADRLAARCARTSSASTSSATRRSAPSP